MATPLRNGKAPTPSSTLLGTPLLPRERSTGAPSPSPSIMSRYNKSSNAGAGNQVVTSPFGSGPATKMAANSPLRFTSRQDTGSPQKAPHADSISGATVTTATSTVTGSDYENSITEHVPVPVPFAAPTPRPTAASSAPTRIVADPSIATTFRKEDDPELYDLFLG